MLAVRDAAAAIAFYKAAFGAELLWHLGGGEDIVAGLSIDGAQFFLASESPQYGTRGPNASGDRNKQLTVCEGARLAQALLTAWPRQVLNPSRTRPKIVRRFWKINFSHANGPICGK